MANATQTIAGDIQLAGDLGGNNNAASPALSATGVTAGSYSYPTITVDAKGRITAATDGTPSLSGDVTGLITNATLAATGVTAGSYTNANITVDAKGRITAASNGTVYSSLSGDVTGTFGANSLTTTGVTAGSYNLASITVDAKGRVTAASNGSVADATIGTKGIVSIATGTGLTITSGVLSGTPATNSNLGVVKSGNTANISITSGSIDVGANVAKFDTGGQFTKAINSATVALGTSGTIAVNASLSNVFTVTLTGNATLANPTNLLAGQYTFIITQGSPARTLSFGTAYKFSGSSTISNTTGSINIIRAISDGTSLYCSLATGFA